MKRTVWVIMSVCRKYILQGSAKSREAVRIEDNDTKMLITFPSEKKAAVEAKRRRWSCWSGGPTWVRDIPMEPVKATLTIDEIGG